MKPWTWKQIAALRGAPRDKFLADYGDRAKVALVIAGDYGGPSGSCLGWYCLGWYCHDCPMSVGNPTKWSIAVGLHIGCPENAIPIYRLMIAKLGRLPEVPEPEPETPLGYPCGECRRLAEGEVCECGRTRGAVLGEEFVMPPPEEEVP